MLQLNKRFFLATLLLGLVSFSACQGPKPVSNESTQQETSRKLTSEGNRAFSKNDMTQALPAYKKAIEVDPKHISAYNNLSLVYAHTQNYDQAIATAEKAIEIDPSYTSAYFNLVGFYAAKKDCTKAQEYFTKAKAHKLSKPDQYLKNFHKYCPNLS